MSNFIDECVVHIKGGDGGAGCISFRKEAHTPKGGPDGGDGGKGGDVWVCADLSTSSLIALTHRPHQKAKNGIHGKGKKKHGASGQDCIIQVPVGTQVFSQSGEKLADLTGVEERYLAMPGGFGGKGNARFLSNRRRAPSFAEQGELGTEASLRLELKLLADIAIVGFPNSGKSTLISKISSAKPKIADYPFTTLEPNLGVVVMNDGSDFVVADIPGLIEGASQGRGLGLKFLRHIERAKILAVLLDLTSLESPQEQLEILLGEVQSYNPQLLNRPRILIGSKLDQSDSDNSKKTKLDFLDICISSVVGTGIPQLKGIMAETLSKENKLLQELEPKTPAPVVHRPQQSKKDLLGKIEVEKIGDRTWRLMGRSAERAVALSDLTDPEAMICAQERLTELGTDRLLSLAGAQDGDTVFVGDFEFEFYN